MDSIPRTHQQQPFIIFSLTNHKVLSTNYRKIEIVTKGNPKENPKFVLSLLRFDPHNRPSSATARATCAAPSSVPTPLSFVDHRAARRRPAPAPSRSFSLSPRAVSHTPLLLRRCCTRSTADDPRALNRRRPSPEMVVAARRRPFLRRDFVLPCS